MQLASNNTILDKVRKLLALAKSDNINESDAALSKASALAAEHGIDLAISQLDCLNCAPEKFEGEQTVIEIGKRQPTIGKYVYWLLQDHFSVKLIFSGNRSWGKKMSILGHKPDVEMANYLYSYLLEEFDRRWSYYAKSNGLSVKEKQTYLFNMYRGLDQKLNESKTNAINSRMQEVPEAIRSNVSNQYALVIKDKAMKIHEFVKERFPQLRNKSSTNIHTTNNEKVANDGFASGFSMNINRPLAGAKCLN